MWKDDLIPAQGGQLVDRCGATVEATPPLASVTLTERQQCEFEMIAIGAMSPLEGFMGEADYHSACDHMTLSNGTIWPMPITCAVDSGTADKIAVGARVALNDDAGRLLGYLTVDEKYKQDKAKHAVKGFGTDDPAHPGVKVLMEEGDFCLA